MSDLSSMFKEALKIYVEENTGSSVKEILSFTDKVESGGYCETCRYTNTFIFITYLTEENEYKEFRGYESFSELLERLLKT